MAINIFPRWVLEDTANIVSQNLIVRQAKQFQSLFVAHADVSFAIGFNDAVWDNVDDRFKTLHLVEFLVHEEKDFLGFFQRIQERLLAIDKLYCVNVETFCHGYRRRPTDD